MRLLLGLGMLLSAPLFASTTFLTQVHRLDNSSRPDEESLVFLANGRVMKASLQNTNLLNQLERSRRTHSWVKVTIDSKRHITAVARASSPFNKDVDEDVILRDIVQEEYIPSVLTLDYAKTIFRDHRIPVDRETQCYNRAHVWVYDWRTKRNVYSNKQWIFFTAKYIRKYNFEWWFHVAPMVHIVEDGVVKERVMDMKYSRGPNTTKQWSDIFMKDDAECPTVKTYSDHADYPESGSCFLMRSSMYYYQPIDLEFKEKFGTDKSLWVASEVIQAYNEAFEIYP